MGQILFGQAGNPMRLATEARKPAWRVDRQGLILLQYQPSVVGQDLGFFHSRFR
jgi:hypothetical protein